jgi:hypothetical protein
MPRKAAATKAQKLLSESKVLRVLESMGVDPAKFRKAYEQEPSRRGRGMREPEPREIKAVEEFQKTGDFGALRKALGNKPAQIATAAVARVIAFRAQQQDGGRGRRAD